MRGATVTPHDGLVVSGVRVGLGTPIVTRLPGTHGGWEGGAGLAGLVDVVRAADRLGVHHVTCSEHVAIPSSVAAVRGGTYWDPLATFGYLAACTERIRLATYVLVLGYHHPLEIAKRYGTLDVVSGGRLVLGVGVGTLREEFEVLGVPFEGRGSRADDALRALRSSLSTPRPVHDGTHYRYDDVIVEPCALQDRVPLWVGGRTVRSLRRAVALADGWAPFGLTAARLAEMLAGVEHPEGFEVVLTPERALDPAAEPGRVEEALGELARVGATIVSPRLVGHSLAHYVEQLEALAALGSSRAAT